MDLPAKRRGLAKGGHGLTLYPLTGLTGFTKLYLTEDSTDFRRDTGAQEHKYLCRKLPRLT
jgi:hypothetical protein